MFIRFVLSLFILTLSLNLSASELVTKEQIKGLDEQVQEIKKEVLSISANLNQLEEKLLFPSSSQVAIFVSLEKDSKTPLAALKIALNKDVVSHHIYSFKEIEALKIGGVQRIFTGNVTAGQHQVEVILIKKIGGGGKVKKFTHSFEKGVKPKLIEIRLSDSGVMFKDW